MPLLPNASSLIRANLEEIKAGKKVRIVPIGRLTDEQLSAVNVVRAAHGLKPIAAEVVFVGAHIYRSRILKDGYTIEDVIEQISSAMDASAVVLDAAQMTAMENPNPRADRYGNQVRDRAVFECSTRHPRPELYSIVPKGDTVKPNKKEATRVGDLSSKSSDSPG